LGCGAKGNFLRPRRRPKNFFYREGICAVTEYVVELLQSTTVPVSGKSVGENVIVPEFIDV